MSILHTIAQIAWLVFGITVVTTTIGEHLAGTLVLAAIYVLWEINK